MHSTFAFAGGPEVKCPQHTGMGKKSIAFIAQNGAVDDAGHVAAGGNFSCRNADLVAMSIGVFNRSSIDDTVKPGPQGRAHTHGARLAGGVERISGERKLLELLGGLANGADFGMGAGVELLRDCVQCAKQRLAGFGVDDGCAEWARAWSLHGAGGECGDCAHLRSIEV